MKKYEYVIFDLDGVLCFTDKYHYMAWKKISDNLGLNFNYEINHKLRGVSRKESFEIILKENNKNIKEYNFEEILNEKNNIYVKLLENLKEEDNLPEIIETLNFFKNNNIKMAIASSSKNARLIIKKLNIEKYFDVVVDGNDIVNSKPDPEVFEKAINKLEVNDLEKVLIVEDSIAGIQSSIKLNVDSVGVKLENKKLSTYNIDKLNEIIKIFN